jgi:hypothetical protein
MNASGRPNTCKSSEKVAILESGARVRNAYTTYLSLGDRGWKRPIIPHSIESLHGDLIKASAVRDRCAFD